MELTCPTCNIGTIIEKPSLFTCSEEKYDIETKTNEGCDFKLWKNIFGTALTIEDVEKLINGETIEKQCVSKQSQKEYTGLLTLDNETYKIALSFPENNNREEVVDENGISEFSKGYKKDGVIVWKTISGQKITKEEAIMLFNGETIKKDNLISQKGNEFSANIFLNEDGKIEMTFDN